MHKGYLLAISRATIDHPKSFAAWNPAKGPLVADRERQLGLEDLQDNAAVVFLVVGEIDNRVAAPAEFAFDV